MRNVILCCCVMLLISGYSAARADKGSDGGRFEFGLIGDMPYDARQEREFAHLMKDMDAADLAFVAHVGDFWFDGAAWSEELGGRPPCSDEAFEDRVRLARASRHPFILVPGDNDWTDCHRAKPRPYDPMERLAKLRQMFFQGDRSLGQRTLQLTRQSQEPRYAAFRENVRWRQEGVLFVTMQVVGSNDNLGRTPQMDAEHAARSEASIAWMKQAFDLARSGGSRALMIIAQADPQFENSWPANMQQRYMLGGLGIDSPERRRVTGFDGFLAALEKEVLAYGRPVVYVHGDTHVFRIDKPLVGATSRRIIENFTRVETFGYPDTHWVRGTVDPGNPAVFSFRPEIVKENLVAH
ncbi:MAG: hypothetical protein ACREAA_12575 [Candidatus Polarisedimenticolia bacterium]